MEAPSSPNRLGEPVSHAGLTVVPIFAGRDSSFEFLSLDEALAAGMSVDEVDDVGRVESVRVTNPLAFDVLLYAGEEIAGAKQDRIFERTTLVPKQGSLEVAVFCVESGRWSYRSRRFRSSRSHGFKSSPHAAYPRLRRSAHTVGQAGVWSDLKTKSMSLGVASPTDAAEALYTSSRSKLDGYLAALPCQAGQCGSIVGIAGTVVCLDFISRPDVWARTYPKLLRGYALEAIDAPTAEELPDGAAAATWAEVATARRKPVPTLGHGELRRLRSNSVIGWELRLDNEPIALAVAAT